MELPSLSFLRNTRNTTTSAIFDYEITGVRPADRKTSDRISGIPFLVPVIQVYGYDSYERDDPKYNEVEEVLYFDSFSDEDEQMDVLNERIEHEILEYAIHPSMMYRGMRYALIL